MKPVRQLTPDRAYALGVAVGRMYMAANPKVTDWRRSIEQEERRARTAENPSRLRFHAGVLHALRRFYEEESSG